MFKIEIKNVKEELKIQDLNKLKQIKDLLSEISMQSKELADDSWITDLEKKIFLGA